ncbi:hypothetical protein QA584_20045 [Anaerocolumna sp. AGMB13025]|uniref:hypothetical protein n=1 Tax=Anaerocolumna sp. AGMB13025 TaxID=3039116 RepID=UPI00241FDFB3|nr:hypothetical protein [Anaerocolumna sp. AGMB13025]WFR55892.1 hypothetical protein QA584_20045 [Anaerocolumna sp. AGMB13025]
MKGKSKLYKKLLYFCSGFVILIVAAFAALLVIGGIFVKPAYLKPWDKEYTKRFEDPRITLCSYGLLAANGHNMQPWKILLDKADKNVFYLYADSDRLTKEVDPYSRQMMVTQGTFLEYVAIGGEKEGYDTKIDLFPEGDYEEENLSDSLKKLPVAKITLTKSNPSNNPLFDTMFLADTNRSAYEKTSLTEEEVSQLNGINTDPSLSLQIYKDEENLNNLGRIAMEGLTVEAGVDRVMEESNVIFRANEKEKNKYRYGFSVEGQGTEGIMKYLMQGLVTLFPSFNQGSAASDLYIKSGKTSVDNTPAYIIIKSKDNSRSSQVKSGMLYSRLIAKAHTLGLVTQPLSQALEEYPEMSEVYKEIHKDYGTNGATIQMLVRIGKPTKDSPLSMRQDIMDLIIKE